MTQGERNSSAAEVAAALVEVAIELGGVWAVIVGEDGQLRLVPADDVRSPRQ